MCPLPTQKPKDPVLSLLTMGGGAEGGVTKGSGGGLIVRLWHLPGFPGGARCKESACQCRRRRGCGFVAGSSPGGGHGNPLQYSRLENPLVREVRWATVHAFTKPPGTTERLSPHEQRHVTELLDLSLSAYS